VNLIADIRSQCAYVDGKEGYKQDDESQISRDALIQLLKFVESRVDTR
jgi:hypothetical protein